MKRFREHEIRCGFIPLTDCASLVVAHEMGFARQEGVSLRLMRETSWSNIRDKLALGLFDVAHMLAPMPIAMSIGASAFPADVSVPFLLSTNGAVVGVSNALADAMGGDGVFEADAVVAAAKLRAALKDRRLDGRPLRVGAPWLYSTHVALLDVWLRGTGFDLEREVEFVVTPPSLMVDALERAEIDAFCVGEPWGSVAVERGVGALLLAGPAIWRLAPEKVLGVSPRLRDEAPDALDALLRALYRAAAWAASPGRRAALAEILSQSGYVDAPAEVLERALGGGYVVGAGGGFKRVERAIEFFDSVATFPWRSQAAWIAATFARRDARFRGAAAQASEVFRTDIYRRALTPIGAPIPAASAKIEGALAAPIEAAGRDGPIALGPDAFFDGTVFDPDPPGT